MDWRISLDKYLTEEPYDRYDIWSDAVIDNFSQEFYEKNEDWIYENDGVCNKWMNNLFCSTKTEVQSAQIIERAFNIYIKEKAK
jgi:hypothetical protein